jgi:peptidoglycan/LPS O-acetylase OafA/YrhL
MAKAIRLREFRDMTLNDQILLDPPATRRIRRLAPLVILLVLAALIIAPGLIAEQDDDATLATAGAEVMSGLSAVPLLLVAGLRQLAG